MARTISDAENGSWEVELSGRTTQYGVDELSIEFRRMDGDSGERRYARVSPRGAKSGEMALGELSDRALVNLLQTAQPAWTSPDGGYATRA